MSAADFRQFIAHAYWGRDKLLAAFDALGPEALAASPVATLRSPAEILSHQLGFEMFWLAALHGEPLPHGQEVGTITTAGDARERWAPVETRWRAFAEALTDADLDRPVPVHDAEGNQFRPLLRQVLSQFVQHEGQHRSELALLATELGSSPGEFDWWDFLEAVRDSRSDASQR